MNPMATTSWATSIDSEFSPALPSASAKSRRRMLEALAPRDSRILAPSSATRARAADRARSSSMRTRGPTPPRPSARGGGGGAPPAPPPPPYLDYDGPRPDEGEAIGEIAGSDWARGIHEKAIRARAYREGLLPRMEEVRTRVEAETDRTRRQVRERLLAEINHWDSEYTRLEALERSGAIGRLRAETAYTRARQLDERLEHRLDELEQTAHLVAVPSVIRGIALVIPSRIVAAGDGEASTSETEAVERRAVEAVLAAARAPGGGGGGGGGAPGGGGGGGGGGLPFVR